MKQIYWRCQDEEKIFLFFALCSMMIFLLGMTVSADENDAEGFYIMSEECPEEAVEYVKENLYSYTCDLLEVDDRYADIDVLKLVLGSPFEIQKETAGGIDIYYFPVMYEDEIRFTIRVYRDEYGNGEYTGIFSEYLAAELEAAAGKTSQESPLTLSVNNGNIMQTIAGNSSVFLADPMGHEIKEQPSAYSNPDLMVKNVKELIEYDVEPIENSRASTVKKYIKLDKKETQGQQSWCAAFAGSAIIRCRTSNKVYAEDIMSYYYPNSTNLEKKSLSDSKLIAYAKLKGCSPIKLTDTLPQLTVVSQIDAGRPIYLGCEGTGDRINTRHALVLRGYNTKTGKYSVWNPWNPYYEIMPVITKAYAIEGVPAYIWVDTIYNW